MENVINVSVGYNDKIGKYYIYLRDRLEYKKWRNYFDLYLNKVGGNVYKLDSNREPNYYDEEYFDKKEKTWKKIRTSAINHYFEIGSNYNIVVDVVDNWKAYMSQVFLVELIKEFMQINRMNQSLVSSRTGKAATQYTFNYNDDYGRKLLEKMTVIEPLSQKEAKALIIIENRSAFAKVCNPDKYIINELVKHVLDVTKSKNYQLYGEDVTVQTFNPTIKTTMEKNIKLFYFEIGVGLVNFVKEKFETDAYLKQFNLAIWDKRTPGTKKNKFDIQEANKTSWPGLYEYQKEALENVLKYYNGIIKIATGGGKTYLAMGIIGAIGEDTLYIVPSKPLANQVYKEFVKMKFPSVGIFYGDERLKRNLKPLDPNVLNVNIAVINSAASILGMKTKKSTKKEEMDERFRKIMKSANVLIFDEAHHLKASTYKVVNELTNATYRFGLTATPYDAEGEQEKGKLPSARDMAVRNAIGDVIVDKTATELINGRHPLTGLPYLATPIIKVITIPVYTPEEIIKMGIGIKHDPRNPERNPNDYFQRLWDTYENYKRDPRYVTFKTEKSRGMLKWFAIQDVLMNNNQYKDLIIAAICKGLYDRKMSTIIIADAVPHMQRLQQLLLSKYKIKSVIVNSRGDNVKEKERDAAFESIAKKEVYFLIGSAALLGEGINIPSLMCAIIANGGKSLIKTFQRVGRVMRIHPEQPTVFRQTHSLIIEINDVQDLSRRDVFYLDWVDYDQRLGMVKKQIISMSDIYDEKRKQVKDAAVISKSKLPKEFQNAKVPIRNLGKQLEFRLRLYRSEKAFIVEDVVKWDDIFKFKGKEAWK